MAGSRKIVWDCMPYEFVGPFRPGATVGDATVEFGVEPTMARWTLLNRRRYVFGLDAPLVHAREGTDRVVGLYFIRRNIYRLTCDGVGLRGDLVRLLAKWEAAGHEYVVDDDPDWEWNSYRLMPGLNVHVKKGQKTVGDVEIELDDVPETSEPE